MSAPTTLIQQMANNPAYPTLPVASASLAIPGGVAVKLDTAKLIADANPTQQSLFVVVAASDADPCIGVTVAPIASGGDNGAIYSIGSGAVVVMTADGAITAGGWVIASGGSSKKGFAKAQSAAQMAIGIALSTAADAEAVLVLLCGCKNA